MSKKIISTWIEADSANKRIEMRDRKRFRSQQSGTFQRISQGSKNRKYLGDGCSVSRDIPVN